MRVYRLRLDAIAEVFTTLGMDEMGWIVGEAEERGRIKAKS